MLLPVNLGDVIQRPNVHHGLTDKRILSFRSFEVVANNFIPVFAVPLKVVKNASIKIVSRVETRVRNKNVIKLNLGTSLMLTNLKYKLNTNR